MANTVRVGLYDRSHVESYTIHTIVYALPPAWDDWHGLLRRTSHKTIQFLGAKKLSRVTVGAAKHAALFCGNESAVKIRAYVVPNSNEK